MERRFHLHFACSPRAACKTYNRRRLLIGAERILRERRTLFLLPDTGNCPQAKLLFIDLSFLSLKYNLDHVYLTHFEYQKSWEGHPTST